MKSDVSFEAWRQFSLRMGNETYTPSATIYMKFDHSYANDTISAFIHSIGYTINCSYSYRTTGGTYSGGPYACGHLDGFQVKDDVLLSKIRTAKSSPKQTLTPNFFKPDVINAISNRFEVRTGSVEKITKTYNIDFATAKSRLQRALNLFKYDNDKSTFTFEEIYTNPIPSKAHIKIKHIFILSLFPDRNNTVIEYSGKYDYFKDLFDGSDKFGEANFSLKVNSYIQNVNTILSK